MYFIKFLLRNLRKRRIIYLRVSFYSIIILILVYHEKILNVIDTFTMPINHELCKVFPFNLSEFYSRFILYMIIIIKRRHDFDLMEPSDNHVIVMSNKINITRQIKEQLQFRFKDACMHAQP
jgi:hypothetical protein